MISSTAKQRQEIRIELAEDALAWEARQIPGDGVDHHLGIFKGKAPPGLLIPPEQLTVNSQAKRQEGLRMSGKVSQREGNRRKGDSLLGGDEEDPIGMFLSLEMEGHVWLLVDDPRTIAISPTGG